LVARPLSTCWISSSTFDGVVNRLARAQVLHRAGLQVDEGEVVDPRGHRAPHLGLAALVEHLHGVRGHVLHDVDLAGEQRGQPRAELGDEADGHAVQIGSALPVVGVLLHHELLVAHPLHELERPGADGLGGEGLDALLLERLGRHGQKVGGGDAVDQAGPRLVGDEAHGVVVDHLDVLHLGPARRIVRLVRRGP
jgi:hypothetical protein